MLTPQRNLIHILFSHEDLRWRRELDKHLKPLAHNSSLETVWSEIRLDASWYHELEHRLSRARIVILLVSPDFLASETVSGPELAQMLEAAQERVVWIPIRPAFWEESVVARYQAAWDPNRPLSTLDESERETALADIGRTISRILSGREPSKGPKDRAFSSTTKPSSLLVRKVRLRNIRCFQDITLDLSVNGRPTLRTVILGDNATGKTTLLRAIALGLCDESDATALLKRVPGAFVRKGQPEEGIIEIELVRNGSGESHTIRTEIIPTDSGSEVVRKKMPPDLSSMEGIFVVGYGTERTKPGIRSYDRYTAAAAVMTLFDYTETLQNPELVLRRQPVWLRDQLEEKLVAILLLDEDDGRIDDSDKALDVIGPWGRQPLEVLSDGYRSTAQWILDFASWLVYAGRVSDPEGLTGIVLIDELEQHLHPQWQRMILSRLRQHLPGVQFILTSHSPLIAKSVGSIDPEESREKLIHISRNEAGQIVALEPPSLKGMSTDQVLASQAFDYLTQGDPEVERVLAEASRLASKGLERSGNENDRYQKVKDILNDVLAQEGDTLIEREVRQELHQRMKERIRELEEAVFEGAH